MFKCPECNKVCVLQVDVPASARFDPAAKLEDYSKWDVAEACWNVDSYPEDWTDVICEGCGHNYGESWDGMNEAMKHWTDDEPEEDEEEEDEDEEEEED